MSRRENVRELIDLALNNDIPWRSALMILTQEIEALCNVIKKTQLDDNSSNNITNLYYILESLIELLSAQLQDTQDISPTIDFVIPSYDPYYITKVMIGKVIREFIMDLDKSRVIIGYLGVLFLILFTDRTAPEYILIQLRAIIFAQAPKHAQFTPIGTEFIDWSRLNPDVFFGRIDECYKFKNPILNTVLDRISKLCFMHYRELPITTETRDPLILFSLLPFCNEDNAKIIIDQFEQTRPFPVLSRGLLASMNTVYTKRYALPNNLKVSINTVFTEIDFSQLTTRLLLFLKLYFRLLPEHINQENGTIIIKNIKNNFIKFSASSFSALIAPFLDLKYDNYRQFSFEDIFVVKILNYPCATSYLLFLLKIAEINNISFSSYVNNNDFFEFLLNSFGGTNPELVLLILLGEKEENPRLNDYIQHLIYQAPLFVHGSQLCRINTEMLKPVIANKLASNLLRGSSDSSLALYISKNMKINEQEDFNNIANQLETLNQVILFSYIYEQQANLTIHSVRTVKILLQKLASFELTPSTPIASLLRTILKLKTPEIKMTLYHDNNVASKLFSLYDFDSLKTANEIQNATLLLATFSAFTFDESSSEFLVSAFYTIAKSLETTFETQKTLIETQSSTSEAYSLYVRSAFNFLISCRNYSFLSYSKDVFKVIESHKLIVEYLSTLFKYAFEDIFYRNYFYMFTPHIFSLLSFSLFSVERNRKRSILTLISDVLLNYIAIYEETVVDSNLDSYICKTLTNSTRLFTSPDEVNLFIDSFKAISTINLTNLARRNASDGLLSLLSILEVSSRGKAFTETVYEKLIGGQKPLLPGN